MRIASPLLALTLELAARLIAGTAGVLMGYEIGVRTAAKSISDHQINTAVGLLLLVGGVICIAHAIARALNKEP